MNPEDARHDFRECLRQLCIKCHELAMAAGLSTDIAAQIVAEECLHMSAFFVTRGSTWSADAFTEECRKVYDWHKSRANTPTSSSLN